MEIKQPTAVCVVIPSRFLAIRIYMINIFVKKFNNSVKSVSNGIFLSYVISPNNFDRNQSTKL